jgi:hypothetical protein
MMTMRSEFLKKPFLLLVATLLSLGALVAVDQAAEAAYAKSPPTGLRQVEKTGTSITVGWNATSGANLYYVRYSSSSSMSGAKTLSSASTTKQITGLKPDTWYYIQVRSAKGTTASHTLLSAYSSSVNIRTPSFTFDPPASFSADFARTTSVDLSWKFVNNADSYSLEIKGGSPSTTRYVRVRDTDTLRTVYHTATGLQSGRSYSFRVKALEQKVDPTADPNGPDFGYYELTDWSGTRSITTPTTPPTEPVQPAANLRATSVDRTTASLAWDPVAGAAEYRVFWTKDASPPSKCEPTCHVITPTNLAAPTDQITGLTPGTPYYVMVSAIDANGSLLTSYQRRPLEILTTTSAPGPVAQVPYASATAVKMDWPDLSGATKYEAKLSASQSMSSPTTKTVTTSEALWTGLGANKLYFAQVRAEVSGAWGDWSVITGAHTRDVFGAITGRVNDGGTGSAQGTYVWAYDSAGQVTGGDRVGPDGTYTILGLPAGKYRVLLDQKGGFNVTSPWVANAGGPGAVYRSQGTEYAVTNSVLTVPTITPPAGIKVSGAVTGSLCRSATRVTALSDNSAVSGAKDAVMGDSSTASNGTYEIIGLPKNEAFYFRFGSSSCGTKSVHVNGSSANVSGVDTSFDAATGGGETIPASVEGLTASNVSATGATISWKAVPTATKYRVYWSYSASMPGACEPTCHLINATTSVSLASILSGNPSGGNTTPTGGKTYYLKVSAVNSAGKAITGWQTTALKVALPAASGGGEAIPSTVQGITADNISYVGADVSWDPVPTATQYRVYWSTSATMSGACEPNCHKVAGNALTLAQVLSPSSVSKRAYYFKVSAIDASGKTITGWQPSAYKIDLPAATVKLGDVTSASTTDATVNWAPLSAAGSYRVYWSTSKDMSSACEPTCHVIPSGSAMSLSQIMSGNPSGGNATPQSGQTYYVKISAISASTGKTISGWQSTPLAVTLPS